MCSMLGCLPIDIWFEIAILLDRYDEYLEVTKSYPKLQTEERLLDVRIRLTKHYGSSNHEYWKLDGRYHRDGDLPSEIYTFNGGYCTKYWSKYGKLHREGDLPSVISYDGTQYWYKNGVSHRDVGPAILFPNGKELYYVIGKQYRGLKE